MNKKASFLGKRFQLWWIQALYTAFAVGVVTLLYYYFVAQSISFVSIFLADALASLVIVLYFIFRRTLHAKKSIAAGFIVLISSLLLFFLPLPIIYVFFPYMILRGLGGIMFFVPYNIQFFARTKKGEKLQSVTRYWAISIITGFIAPLVGGYVLGTFGVSWLLGVGFVLLTLSLWLTRYIKEDIYTYTVKEALTSIKGLRSITAIDGALHKAIGLVVVFFSLTYIQTELDFGLYLSVAALVSLIGAVVIAKRSDKSGKRLVYIAVLSIFAAAIALGMSIIHTSFAFISAALLFKFIAVLQEPIRANVLQDYCPQVPITWISREIYLNAGRAIISAVVASLIYIGKGQYAFYVIAALFLLYPVLIYTKHIYAKAH